MSSIQKARRSVLLGLCASAAAFLLAAPACAHADDTYAAIAYSAKTGHTGVGSNVDSQDKADAAALAQCKGTDGKADDAKVVVRAMNAWCALAVGEKGKYGIGTGSDQDGARKGAVQACKEVTNYVFVPGGANAFVVSVPSKPDNVKVTSFMEFAPMK